jgi:hypothetical protein
MGTLTQFKTPSGLSYLGWAQHHFSRGNDDPGELCGVLCSIDSLASPLPSRRLKLAMALTPIPYLVFFLNFQSTCVLWDTNMGT